MTNCFDIEIEIGNVILNEVKNPVVDDIRAKKEA
jgi:hypothetical protein